MSPENFEGKQMFSKIISVAVALLLASPSDNAAAATKKKKKKTPIENSQSYTRGTNSMIPRATARGSPPAAGVVRSPLAGNLSPKSWQQSSQPADTSAAPAPGGGGVRVGGGGGGGVGSVGGGGVGVGGGGGGGGGIGSVRNN